MKKLNVQLFSVLAILFILSTCGVLVFIKGFLLSRTVVDWKSMCNADFASKVDDHMHHGVEGCWMHGRFKRAVIVIIDALKYDFVSYNSSFNEKANKSPPYKNKLTSIYQLLKNRPRNSRLYKFIADPPTTTMQRLKGLTTGSLPTFVDAGTNFQSYEITEDNIIDQLVAADKKIKFLGDDTWLGLFPKRFYKAYDFPSFNVKDLHTVDNGVLQHIYPEMRKLDWDVIIAHFLGVDHCGHKYGPNHPAMAEKLTQMDAMLRNVTNLLRDDTIMFVMGDHGMTRTGDHGGDSADELEAALFVYSPVTLFPDKEQTVSAVKQTDFVPTFSLLMGLPIPFSNLGMVVPELFSHCSWWDTQTNPTRRVYHRVKALRLNALQIDAYLSAYSQVSSDLNAMKLNDLRDQLSLAESRLQGLLTTMMADGMSGDDTKQLASVQDMLTLYLQEAREMCEAVWAKFNLTMIVLGLLTIVAAVLLGINFLTSWEQEETTISVPCAILLGVCSLHVLYVVVHVTLLPETVPPVMAFVLASGLIVASTVLLFRYQWMTVLKESCTFTNIVASLIVVLYCSAYFSNSFVVYEDSMTIFFMQTLVLAFGAEIVFNRFSIKRDQHTMEVLRLSKKGKSHVDISQILFHPNTSVACVVVVSWIVLRLSSNFWYCREEQNECEDSIFTSPLTNIEGSARNQRYIFSVLCLGAMVFAVRIWLRFYGNLNGSELGVLALKYGPIATALFTSLHWAVQAVPEMEALPGWQQVLMARAVYLTLGLALMALLGSPLLVYTLHTQKNSKSNLTELPFKSQNAIPTLYHRLKQQLTQDDPQKGQEGSDKPPMVFGLGSVYCAGLVALVSLVSLGVGVLLGCGMAPSLCLATLLLYTLMELYSATLTAGGNQGPSWSGVVMLHLAGSVFFYGTGHQATIPSIRFESAYTGFYGDLDSIILPGFLVWMNTFAGPVLFTLAGPLLMFWPALSSTMSRWMSGPHRERATWQGDFTLFDNAFTLRKRLFKICCSTIVISALKMLSAACAAALHRRHLMVWKIFAPRVIYEAAMFVTVSICTILSYLFVLRIDWALGKFVNKLPDKKQS